MNVLIPKIKHLFLVLLLAAAIPVAAQNTRLTPEDVAIVDQFVDNYDSLLNSYVAQRYQSNHKRYINTSAAERSFEQVADSTVARRLRALHTVIPMDYNDKVRSFIRLYLNRIGARLDGMLTLCDYYQPIFEEALSRWNVPEELRYLPIVESAMNPNATSRVGAAGLWQFMYTTGKNYGLEVNSVVDERRDSYKSSEAAAHYLHDLYVNFGNWHLAIAAYNCGPGNINKAIARSGGKRTFWEIYPYLPRETRNYIPAFIAAVYVMNYYPEHGLKPSRINIPRRTDTLMVERNMLFTYVSRYAEIPIEELRSLNPQYRADFIPGEGNSYPFCFPTDKLSNIINWADTIFMHSEDSLNRQPVVVEKYKKSARTAATAGATYHKVRRGENLTAIAKKHGTTVQRLKSLNNLRSDKIREGQRLRVR